MPHDHDHGHDATRFGTAFAVGAALNIALVTAQVVWGVAANSMALLADAAHNAGNVLGLLLAWGAVVLGQRPPTVQRTYGWGRSSILAALANAVVLLISVGAIAVVAVQRLLHPAPVTGMTVIWIASAGILIRWTHGLAVHAWPPGHQHPCHLHAHGGGCRHLGGRAHGGRRHTADREVPGSIRWPAW